MSLVTLIALATLVADEHPLPKIQVAPEALKRAMDRTIKLDIRAGPARETLALWDDTVGLQMLYDHAALATVPTNAISGTYTVDESLKAMLASTSITYEWLDADTVSLTAAEATTISPPLTEDDRVLITDTCQFGRISAAQAAGLIGETPGYCWCCMNHGDDTQNLFCTPIQTVESCAVFDSKDDAYPRIVVRSKREP